MVAIRRGWGRGPNPAPVQRFTKRGARIATALVRLVKTIQLDPEDGGLKSIEALGSRGQLMMVACRLAVRAQQAHTLG
jgi:hypothetical protein